MKRICIFCGSSTGNQELYRKEAKTFGTILASNNIEMVYGGGNVGLMGVIADAVIEAGGSSIGIIPERIANLEIAHQGITRLEVVQSMAERKERMIELSDGFVALPGGFGTLDELMEVLTSSQLRIIDKPAGLLNVGGFFNTLISFFKESVTAGFVRQEHLDNLYIEENGDLLIEKMLGFKPVEIGKWIEDIKQE